MNTVWVVHYYEKGADDYTIKVFVSEAAAESWGRANCYGHWWVNEEEVNDAVA